MDAYYAAHEKFKDHTGAMILLRQGAVTSFSINQKIQGNSSTEDELIGVDDILPQAIQTKHFIKDQGYSVDRKLIKQDNKSAILMETNVRFSSSKITKHIKTRYFLSRTRWIKGILIFNIARNYPPSLKTRCGLTY